MPSRSLRVLVVQVHHVVDVVGAHHVRVQRARLGLDLRHVVAVEVHLVGVVPREVPAAVGNVVVQREVDVAHGAVGVEHRNDQHVDAIQHTAGLARPKVLDELQRPLGGQLFVPVLLGQEQDRWVVRVRDVLGKVKVATLDRLPDHLEFHGLLPGVLLF